MSVVSLTKNKVQEFCTSDVEVVEAINKVTGEDLFVKFLRIDLIDKLGISDCLDFNREVMGDTQVMVFPQHFLKIEEEIIGKDICGLVTLPYTITLEKYTRTKTLKQKEALEIFDQVMKAAYSLYQQGYASRNIRTQHFVLSKKVWKLQSLVYNEYYQQANGANSEYLWCPKHQAPQCFKTSIYHDSDFDGMIVWNLGTILVQLLMGNHKFGNLTQMDKFKGQPFSFEAIGVSNAISSKFSEEVKQTLAYMLHYDPKKRITLTQLFQNKMLSPEVAKHYLSHKKVVPPSRISIGKSSVRISKVGFQSKELLDISKTLEQKEFNKRRALQNSKLSNVLDEQEFIGDLAQLSVKIPSKNNYNFGKVKAPESAAQSIDDIMLYNNLQVRKALQIYRSYFDQSQLLIQAIEVVQNLQFVGMKPTNVKELKMLIKYAITFVSLINLNALAEGFNQNRNILDLDGNLYTSFQNCSVYSAFQKIVNFKRNQRADLLITIRNEINMTKDKPLMSNNEQISNMLNRDYKKTTFQDIKVAYRFIVKYAYDAISEQYNEFKKTDMAGKLAQTAMYVTYCLTIDKLYIKEHITDNFKFYFQWIQQAASNYVPLASFKKYLTQAPKQTLIENSRYILKKFYNI